MGREEGKEEQERFYLLVVFHSGFAIFGQGFEVESLSFSVGSAEKPCRASPTLSVLLRPLSPGHAFLSLLVLQASHPDRRPLRQGPPLFPRIYTHLTCN